MAFDPNNPTASGMVLTFDDEFNSPSWSNDGTANGVHWTDHGINPAPSVSPNNVAVSNGVLSITATNHNGTWTSGTLQTVDSAGAGFAQKFGYFEADIKIPGGDGSWPSWWLLSQQHFTSGGPASELDIMENAGKTPSVWAGTVHDGFGNQSALFPPSPDLSQGFHRFGLLWDPNSPDLTWFLDGKEVGTEAKFADTDQSPMFAILGLGIGNNGQGGPDGSTPSSLSELVDNVRIYQFAGLNPTAVAPEAVSPALGNNDPVAHVDALGHLGAVASVPEPVPVAPTPPVSVPEPIAPMPVTLDHVLPQSLPSLEFAHIAI